MKQHYDYIIAGAGASGLSLAWKILRAPLSDKRVLLVDKSLKPNHDKTWCFWDNSPPPFSDLMYRKWDQAEVSIRNTRITKSLKEYTYYCLRNVDFQKFILDELLKSSQFDLLEAEIKDLSSDTNGPELHSDKGSFHAPYIFQSCFSPWHHTKDQPNYPLTQHFVGWEVETASPTFDNNNFVLMDFDSTFDNGIAFIYLLPWSPTSALIEYTIFSEDLLPQKAYEEKISLYINNRYNLKPVDYQVTRKEFGQIPMQDRPPNHWFAEGIMNLGTVGGVTKPSTGYTFKRIQRQTDSIIKDLIDDGIPKAYQTSAQRYKAYDLWLLNIIHNQPGVSLEVFYQLFENNSLDAVFRFLSEESSMWQDLKIMASVPYPPFLKAIWKTKKRLTEI